MFQQPAAGEDQEAAARWFCLFVWCGDLVVGCRATRTVGSSYLARLTGSASELRRRAADWPDTLHLGRPLAVLWSPGGHCATVIVIC